AGRLFLGIPEDKDLKGHIFVSSGLGGMSGAQAKAIEIAGGVGIIAEVDYSRIETRLSQRWVSNVVDDVEKVVSMALEYKEKGLARSIAYYGNVVDLLEYLVNKGINVELLSDQTSCHAVYEGGYTPQGLSFEEGRRLLKENRGKFKEEVNRSLKRHFELLKELVNRGGHFWDYGNSFMKAVFDAGVKEIAKNGRDVSEGFIFPSYVENIMGPLCFDYGYGPFRWVCLSRKHEDLIKTDLAAMSCIDPNRRSQDRDNYHWIKDAEKNNLVVGTEARILYADAETRVKIALKFNEMVRRGEVGPIMLGRDHHDTGGTDSPFRETANIKDGSNVMADMAVHCFGGNIARGMTMVVLSNGGGVGIGKAINGGFGLVLDGSEYKDEVIRKAMDWDVMVGVSRRSWARNENAMLVSKEWNEKMQGRGHITMPYVASDELVDDIVDTYMKKQL
ncbi:MAG: urocanate hydratase, partial [Synergistetes bacterium]|nr:urocanate hydratase [Synergistota bacterium]